MYYAKRTQLSALEISGEEAADFLNDLLTAQIATLEVGAAQAACLLSPQGRILFDMMVFRPAADMFWLQLASSELSEFRKRLMMYRLRRAVGIEICETWHSVILFSEQDTNMDLPETGYLDPRDAQLGRHIVGTKTPDVLNDVPLVSEAQWDAFRIRRNVPEGPVDLVRNRALMLEAGLDNFHAVDFSKGCYIGQEVTARTHYRGLVKRRILAIKSGSAGLVSGMDVSHNDVVIGQTLSSASDGTVALANLRLDAVQAHLAAGDQLLVAGSEISVHYPSHLPEIRYPG